MNTLQIDCFLEAAKCGSFSLAASRLFVSQPTLSRNIVMLEKELGVTLFYRNSFHGISLTEAGKIMMETLSTTKKLIASGLEQARAIENSRTIHMNLGLLEGQLLDDKLSDLISDFRNSCSNVKISIVRDDYQGLMNSLLSDEISIVYMPAWQFGEKKHLSIHTIHLVHTILVVPKRLLPQVEDRSYSLTEFKTFPFVSVDEQESKHASAMLHNLCRDLGIHPVIHDVSSIQEQIQMVEMGEGVIPINPFNSICYSPNVNCIKIREFEAQPFAVAWKTASNSEGDRLFRSFLESYNHTIS